MSMLHFDFKEGTVYYFTVLDTFIIGDGMILYHAQEEIINSIISRHNDTLNYVMVTETKHREVLNGLYRGIAALTSLN